jgi:hypothetical protein
LTTSTLYGHLRRVLSPSENRDLHGHLARLVVLYEDLRIEMHGLRNKEEYALLDDSGFATRQSYFLRRSFATLAEFAEAVRLADECPEFATVLKPTLDAHETATWDAAVAHFKREESSIKKIRNDIGGHFGLPAARYSVDALDAVIFSGIECYELTPGVGGVRIRFAPYVANTAMLPNAQGSSMKEQLEYLVDLVNESMAYAVPAVVAVSFRYLRNRFRLSG